MTAINSNRAIRGPVTAVPVVAGKGVRLVADTQNNRIVAEADETVLWEGTPTQSDVQLSESMGNFDRVLFYFTKVDDPYIGTFVDIAWGVKTSFTFMHHVGATNAYIQLAKLGYNDSTYTITFSAGKNLGFGNYTTTTWANPTVSSGVGDSFYLYKVVGINRVSASA